MPVESVIWGPPGTGKTTAGTTLVREWLSMGYGEPGEIAYLAFTKAAARATIQKLSDMDSGIDDGYIEEHFPLFRTIHSLTYRGIRRRMDKDRRVVTPSDMKRFSQESGWDAAYAVPAWEDLADVYQRLQDQGRTEWDNALTAYTLTRISCRTVAEVERAKAAMSRLASSTLRVSEDVYRTFVSKYEAWKEKSGLLDFTDMLTFALREMPPLDFCRHVVIDEAQDLCPLHHALVDKLFSNAASIHWIGDDDQCQPAGTKVLVDRSGNEMDISEIRAGMTLVSYDRRGAALVSGKRVLKTDSRSYTGRLFKVMASGRKTLATANHRFLIRWTDEARHGKVCVTYLMQRRDRWRVGWCQLFNSDGALHINICANLEKAERVWILRVHESRTEASVYESILAAKFGLPTTTFEPVEGAEHLTRYAIDAIFDGVGDCSSKAVRCLEEHGRDVRWPFIDKVADPGRHRSTLMEVRACNLLSNLMRLPVPDDVIKRVAWRPLVVESYLVVGVSVYSLSVEDHKTYVADKIVTHNSIYKFAGASAELFLERARRARYQVELRQTHRFGQPIVDFSKKIIRRVRDRFEKSTVGVPGRNGAVVSAAHFKPVHSELLILHRHVQGCQSVAQAYIAAGVPFTNERGKDPLSASSRIKAWRAVDLLSRGEPAPFGQVKILIEDLMPSVLMNESEGTKVRLIYHGAKAKLEGQFAPKFTLRDLSDLKILTQDGVKVIRERLFHVLKHGDDLAYYQRVVANGYDLESPKAVITTIHGSKGRQAKEVVVFSETGKKCWADPDTEHRLAYVAATRTEGELTVCGERTVDWADKPYMYPFE